MPGNNNGPCYVGKKKGRSIAAVRSMQKEEPKYSKTSHGVGEEEDKIDNGRTREIIPREAENNFKGGAYREVGVNGALNRQLGRCIIRSKKTGRRCRILPRAMGNAHIP